MAANKYCDNLVGKKILLLLPKTYSTNASKAEEVGNQIPENIISSDILDQQSSSSFKTLPEVVRMTLDSAKYNALTLAGEDRESYSSSDETTYMDRSQNRVEKKQTKKEIQSKILYPELADIIRKLKAGRSKVVFGKDKEAEKVLPIKNGCLKTGQVKIQRKKTLEYLPKAVIKKLAQGKTSQVIFSKNTTHSLKDPSSPRYFSKKKIVSDLDSSSDDDDNDKNISILDDQQEFADISISKQRRVQAGLSTMPLKFPFICPCCQEVFCSFNAMENHLQKFKRGRSIACAFCGKELAHYKVLMEHYRRDHPDGEFTCWICGTTFIEYPNLATHLEKHADESSVLEMWPCDHCNKVFDSQMLDFVKVEIFEGPGLVKTQNIPICPFCQKTCKNEKFLERHMMSHVEERPHKCTVCKKPFKRYSDMKKHIRVKHQGKGKEFHCNECPKVFKTKHGFIDHMNRHQKQYVLHCEVCGNGYVTKHEFEMHMKKRHSGIDDTLICFICGRSCCDKYSLASHLKTHEDDYHDEKFSCDICGKMFAQKRGLDRHIVRIHKDGGTKFICNLCGKEVSSRTSLRGHLLTHEGAKPLKCPQCDKCFAIKTTLKIHLLTHTGERPHKCNYCEKTFTQRGPLKAHMRTHTGEMPYECEICNSAFITKGLLTSHIKKKHDLV